MRFTSVISWFILIVISKSCTQDQEEKDHLVLPVRFHCNYYADIAHEKNSDSSLHATEYFYRKKLLGDFNGNGIQDTLYESLMSRATGKFIDSLVHKVTYKNSYDPYGCLVDTLCSYDPVLKIKAKGFNDLNLKNGCQTFGILVWENIGNIDAKAGDELALVINHADWSTMNSCHIYSYCNNEWQRTFRYEIREYQLYRDDNGPDFSEILKKKNSEWYWLDADFIEGGEVWRTFTDCECKPAENN